jgi:hypothetical protein
MKRYESWPAVKAAARYLACSIEVLQWYAQQGRITTRDRRGVTVYRPADLARIHRKRSNAAHRLPGDVIGKITK